MGALQRCQGRESEKEAGKLKPKAGIIRLCVAQKCGFCDGNYPAAVTG